MKKRDSRVKTQKGSLERKWEDSKDSWTKQTEKREGNDRTAPEAFMRSLTSFKIKKILTFYFKSAFPKFLSLSRWVLTPVKLSYSKTKKMNLFKMLDFQRIHFSKKKKGLGNVPPLLLNQIVKINLLRQIIRFPS